MWYANLLLGVGYGLLYIFSGKLGIHFSSMPPGNLTLIWFASGVGLLALRHIGWMGVPFIFLSSLFLNSPYYWELSTASGLQTLFMSVVSAGADALQCILAWRLASRLEQGLGGPLFRDSRCLPPFLLRVCVVPAVLTSWVPVLAPQMIGMVGRTGPEFFQTVATVTLADAMGLILLGPLGWPGAAPLLRRSSSTILLGIACTVAPAGAVLASLWADPHLLFLAFPLGLVAAAAAPHRMVVLGGVGTALIALVGASRGLGLFAPMVPDVALFTLSIFLLSLAITQQFAALLLAEILRYRSNLEAAIEQRTHQLRASETRLRESNIAKDRLFSILAHDLKEPFNSLIGLTDLLLSQDADMDPAERQRCLRMVYGNARRTHGLLENLLAWSRAERGLVQCDPEPSSLVELLTDTVYLHTEAARDKGITLEARPCEDLILQVDRNLLAIIMRNLVGNALKYTHRGGRITLSGRRLDTKHAEVLVVDTGVGIAAHRIAMLFSLSHAHSTPGTDREPGTGLGLSLCREFVERQGGRIEVESEVGKGSRFRVVLPLGQRPAE